MNEQKTFYRCKDYHDYNRLVTIDFYEYAAVKETPYGYWIVEEYYKNSSDDCIKRMKRWISKTSRKRYAYPTKAEALHSLKMRKKMQAQIGQDKIDRANAALCKIKEMEQELNEDQI